MSVGSTLLQRVTEQAFAPEAVYRLWLHGSGASRPTEPVTVPSWCTTLKSTEQWQRSLAAMRRLGLPAHNDGPKNWDTEIITAAMLSTDGPILDAGAETYSMVLAALYLYGRRDLTGINLVFDKPFRRGPIRFEPGDITRTRFADETFAGIACQSVVEHGVDLRAYFTEMARILRPGGVLSTSTDYFPEPVDTAGKIAYGVPVKIFTRQDILDALDFAASVGLTPTHEVDLDCTQRPVHWKRMDLRYTFTCITLRKDDSG
jgi:SAM-dependent methyltransferase